MKRFFNPILGLCLLAAALPLRSAAGTALSDDQIRALLRQRVEERKSTPGIVVGMIDTNGSRIIAYGKTALGGTDDVNGDTLFEIGSATKTFTALLLADMAQRGEVRLDDPISKYLPSSVKAPSRDGRQITLRDLAQQDSGLPRMPDNFASGDPTNPYVDYTAKNLFDFLSNYTLPRGVGEKYEYSNLGVGLLGTLLARRAGTSYENLLLTRICRPLAMHDTALTLSPRLRGRFATGHDASLKPVKSWDFDALAGAGAIRSTVRDMLKYVAANLDLTRTPLWPAMELAHQRSEVVVNENTRIGLAWNISDKNGQRIIWHNGQTGGYHSFVGFDPTNKIGVAVLANSANAVEDLGYKLLDISPPKNHQVVQVATAILDRCVGEYELAPGMRISIKRRGDMLLARLTGQSFVEIFPESETEFFYKIVDAQITFKKDAGGKVTALVLHQNGQDQEAAKISDAPPKERQAVKLDPKALDACVGKYDFAPGMIFTIQRENAGLKASLTGQPFFEIYPEDKTNFFFTVVDAQITFVKNAEGKVTSLILHQNGDHEAPRTK